MTHTGTLIHDLSCRPLFNIHFSSTRFIFLRLPWRKRQ